MSKGLVFGMLFHFGMAGAAGHLAWLGFSDGTSKGIVGGIAFGVFAYFSLLSALFLPAVAEASRNAPPRT